MLDKNLSDDKHLSDDKPSFNNLLSKYSIIWIWSILITINTGITYTFYNFNVKNYNTFSLIVVLLNIMAFISSLNAWRRLHQILTSLILPNIFDNLLNLRKISENTRIEEKVYIISSAFQFLIYAIMFRFSAYILESLFNLTFSS